MIRAVPGLRLSVIVQRSGNTEPSPGVRTVRTIDELLATEHVELIVIATPNRSHFQLAKQCLLAGRHVVVDKPFTVTSSKAQELARLADERGRVISVFHNRRWDGDFLTVRKGLQRACLGRAVLFESNFNRFRPELNLGSWREQREPGAGTWMDSGSHLLDQGMVLFGAPLAISADVRTEREGAVVEDAFDVTLHYPGMRALLRSSMLACPTAPGDRS